MLWVEKTSFWFLAGDQSEASSLKELDYKKYEH